MSPACSPGAGGYPSPNEAAVLFSGRPGIRGPSRMYAMREMTENAAIVNTHFLRNPSASSGITGNSLKMSSGRLQPGSRAFLRHGPAEAAAIFVGTAEPAPFLQSIENARPADLRRICGGFAADLRRICGGFSGGFSGAGRPQLQRRNGPDDAEEPPADMPADMPAPCIRPVERRACQGARQWAGYPNTRIRGRPWSRVRSARRPERASLRRLQCARGQFARGQFARGMKNGRAACPVS